ncbi:MAG: inositol monophosphatase family protein [Anaerolineae bacterium]
MNDEAILHIAIAVAHEAGAIVRQAFPQTALTQVDLKGAVNPVTETDKAAEALIIERLREAFPDHRILAEETHGDDWRAWDEPGPPMWLIDPLDGTVNFAHGFPFVGVSLALLAEAKPAVGVVYDPLRDETFAASAGGGTTRNGRRVRVSPVGRLADAFLATGFAYDRRTAVDNNTQRLDHFLRRSQGVRRAGSAAVDLSYVACGRLDGFWEKGLHPWDVAAATLIVQEAGGQVTDFDGGPNYLSGEFFLASNGLIHDEMLRVIREGALAPLPDVLQ